MGVLMGIDPTKGSQPATVLDRRGMRASADHGSFRSRSCSHGFTRSSRGVGGRVGVTLCGGSHSHPVWWAYCSVMNPHRSHRSSG